MELYSEIENCILLCRKLIAQTERTNDDISACLKGEIFDEYKKGTDSVLEKLDKNKLKLLVPSPWPQPLNARPGPLSLLTHFSL